MAAAAAAVGMVKGRPASVGDPLFMQWDDGSNRLTTIPHQEAMPLAEHGHIAVKQEKDTYVLLIHISSGSESKH